jgi:hypothetical protein
MTDRDTRNAKATSTHTYSAHEDFHWIEGSSQGSQYGTFLETTLDISNGIHTCLQLFYTSAIEREANADTEPANWRKPAISIVEADHLIRLSIAATNLLRQDARQRIDWLAETD